MRIDLGDTGKQQSDKFKASTNRLLDRLIECHGVKPEESKAEPDPFVLPAPKAKIWFSIERELDHVLKIEDVIRAVCLYFKVDKLDLVSARRSRNIVRPRQIGYYLAKKLTHKSLPEIGRRFGRRDHTSALWGIQQIEKRRATDAALDSDIASLEEALRA